jgi:hydroxylamine oxidation protein HaoB
LISAETTRRDADVSRQGNKLLPLLGISLVAGGLVLLGWFAVLWFTPEPAPYQYHLVTEGKSEQFPELELDAWPDLNISKYEVRVEEIDKPLGQAYTAQQDNSAPVLISWENNTSELLFAIDQKPSELAGIAKAIKDHASEDALILSWWDTSRQINLLTERETMFTSYLGMPKILPPHWQELSDSVHEYEESFWNSNANKQEQAKFQQFAKALIAAPEEGVTQLRALVGSDREAYLLIHVTDLYRLGLMHPDKFGIAYQNFPLTGNMHGLINHMKVQLDKNEFDTYTLQSLGENEIRVFFLEKEEDSSTLMAQLLPFSEKTSPLELEFMQLVYQHDGYWVFNIP